MKCLTLLGTFRVHILLQDVFFAAGSEVPGASDIACVDKSLYALFAEYLPESVSAPISVSLSLRKLSGMLSLSFVGVNVYYVLLWALGPTALLV